MLENTKKLTDKSCCTKKYGKYPKENITKCIFDPRYKFSWRGSKQPLRSIKDFLVVETVTGVRVDGMVPWSILFYPL